MAEPITSIQLKQQTSEEIQAEKLDELQALLAEQQQALQKIVEITSELNDAGILDAVKASVQAKDDLTSVAVQQLSREPIMNLLKHVLNASEALSSIDGEKSTKLIASLKHGLHEADLANGYDQPVGLLDVMRSLKDPDINRAVKFGLSFFKGVGKGLDEE